MREVGESASSASHTTKTGAHADSSSHSHGGRVTHVAALDGVRGLAVLMVVVFHYTRWFPSATPGARTLQGIGAFGGAGVELFFVLSGFLITRILINTRSHPRYFRNFFARRVLRIFPLYYGVLVAIFLVAPLLLPSHWFEPIQRYQLWLWTYTSNLHDAFRGGWSYANAYFHLNHFWSLAIEEQFYVFWPFVVFVLRPGWLIGLCASILIISPLLRLALALTGTSEFTIHLLTPLRLDGLMAGALIAACMARGFGRQVLAPRYIVLALGIVGLYWLFEGRTPVAAARMMVTFGYSLVALTFGAFLLVVLGAPERSLIRKCMEFGVLISLGKFSYGIYVYHQLIGSFTQPWALEWLERNSTQPNALHMLAYVLVVGGLSYLVARLSYQLFEQRFLGLKRHFSYEQDAHDSSLKRAMRDGQFHLSQADVVSDGVSRPSANDEQYPERSGTNPPDAP